MVIPSIGLCHGLSITFFSSSCSSFNLPQWKSIRWSKFFKHSSTWWMVEQLGVNLKRMSLWPLIQTSKLFHCVCSYFSIIYEQTFCICISDMKPHYFL